MKIKFKMNLTAGVFGILLSIITIMMIPRQIGVEYVVSYGINSRSLPYAIAVCIGICGAGLIFQSVVLKKDKEKTVQLREELRPLILMLGFLAYILVFEKDWMISTALLGCLSLIITKCRSWKYYAVVVVLTIALYFIFVNVFHVRLRSVIF